MQLLIKKQIKLPKHKLLYYNYYFNFVKSFGRLIFVIMLADQLFVNNFFLCIKEYQLYIITN